MKTVIKLSWTFLVAILIFSSCQKNIRPLDVSLSAVSSLIAPADQQDIKLEPQTGASLVFKWRPATTPDSGLILYQIAFDKVDGDFSKPIYQTTSDGSGVQTQATITQKEMNKIASLAGIGTSSSGKLKWAVFASKAANAKLSTEIRTLQIERPAGFAVLPDSLFLTGTATEAGEDITKAIPLKKISAGVFEIYTSLKAGSYYLSDRPASDGIKYYIDANNVIQKGNSSTKVIGNTRVYHLSYDFNVATSSAVEIQSINLYQSAKNQEIGQLTYRGNSIWKIDSLAIDFVQFSWGRDDRYKFIMHTSSGPEYWGSVNVNNVAPAGQPESYFYLVPVTNAQWDNTFKFDPLADGHEVNVEMFFQASGPYTHVITYLN